MTRLSDENRRGLRQDAGRMENHWRDEILWEILDAAEDGAFHYRFDTGELRLDRRAQGVLSGIEDGARLDPIAFLNRVFPDDRAEVEQVVRDIWQGRSDRLRLKIRFEIEGRQYNWVVFRGKAFERDSSGRPLRMAGIVVRSLDTDKIQKEVTKSRDMFRNIVENMPILFEAFDGDGVPLFWNKECERVTGYGAEEIVGSPQVMERLFPESELRREYIEKMLQLSGSYRDWETDFQCKDGVVRTIAWSGISRDYPIPDWWAWIVGVDVTERNRMAKQLKEALTEKEILLKEVHHRVKNNMQVISSLLNLQAFKVQDSKVTASLRECQRRVTAMALVHESIYRSAALGEVDLGAYMTVLIRYMSEFFGLDQTGIRIAVEVRDQILVGSDQAVSCGLIINELLSNALEHAFPQGSPGAVTVCAGHNPRGEIFMEIRDTGVGLPRDFKPVPAGTLGISLVSNLVKHQLQGRFHYESGPGAAFIIEFEPSSKPSEVVPN